MSLLNRQIMMVPASYLWPLEEWKDFALCLHLFLERMKSTFPKGVLGTKVERKGKQREPR